MTKEPQALNFDEFADELLTERQPRALVILASAKIDIQLRCLIAAFLLPPKKSNDNRDELLDGDSPLASFSSRIKMCRRSGLIDDQFASALEKLREIRNKAAHWISFRISDAPLRDQLKHLHSTMSARKSYNLTVSRFFGSQGLGPFERLQATFLTMSALLEGIRLKVVADPGMHATSPKTLD